MKYTILYIICLIINVSLPAQLSIQHSNNIKNVLVDSSSNVLFIDVNNVIYHLDDVSSKPADLSYSRVLVKPSKHYPRLLSIDGKDYTFIDGELIQVSKSTAYIYKSGQKAITHINDTYTFESANLNCRLLSSERLVDFTIQGESCYLLFDNEVIDICNNQRDSLSFDAKSIALLEDESILIGSSNQGLWVLKNGALKRYYVPGVTFPRGYDKIVIYEGRLWMLTNNETLFRYEINRQILQKVAVNVSDFAIDRWHKLWYASGKRLVSNISYINNEVPQIDVTNVKVNDLVVDISEEYINVSNRDEIKIDYGVEYSPSKKVNLEYRINGGVWHSSTKLPLEFVFDTDDKYIVELRGHYNNEFFSDIKKIAFKSTSSFVDSTWFYTFLGLVSLILLLLFSQLRISRQNKLLSAERKALKLQLQLAKKEQKLGQLQLNPHFIFNTMNSINGLIALDRKTDARKALSTFAKMMRTVLTFSFDEKIQIEEEIKFLTDYVELEKLIRDNKFDYQINCSLTKFTIPPMLIQPFVENAIIHGLQHLNKKGKLVLDIEENGRYLKVTITDNGIGREKAKSFRKETHRSSAIKIVKERILNLDKWKSETPVQYVDLYEENESKGTTCILNIPK